MNPKYHKYLIASIICIIGISFHYKTINEFPQYKHCWAQCDRYALAVGFINNGGDFFHPETFLLNKQFPHEFKVPSEHSITSVDFPIHDYIVSLIMKLFGTTEAWCFRIYILLYSMIGLFFIYRISALFTNSFLKSFIIIIFAALSPTLLYYQAGFLPTIPSLANAFIGLFFFFKYCQIPHRKYYVLAIAFLSLAALARLPFAIIIIAIACFELYYGIKTRKIFFFKFFLIIVAIAIVCAYFIYNNYLRTMHGSIFLNYIIPATSVKEAIECLKEVYDKWMFQYFSPFHYIAILILFITFIIQKIKKKIQLSPLEYKLFFLTSIIFTGCVGFFLLMEFQYINHDYYFLDTFYLPIVFIFLGLVVKMPLFKNKIISAITIILIIAFFVSSFIYSQKVQSSEKEKFTDDTTAMNLKNANQILDSLHIPPTAKILVISSDGANNCFLLLRRKGYIVLDPDYEKIKRALTWPYDYVVIENSKLITEVYNQYPNIMNDLHIIFSNNRMSLYHKKQIDDDINFESFFNLIHQPKIYTKHINFDTIPENCFLDSLSANCFSGKKGGFIGPENEYGFTYKIYNLADLNTRASKLVIKSKFLSDYKLNELLMCVSIQSNKKDIMFIASDLSKRLKTNTWETQEFIFSLPKIEEKDFELSLFIWNKGKNTIFYDNFEVTIY